MVQSTTSSNNLSKTTRFAHRLNSDGPKPSRKQINDYIDESKKDKDDKLTQISLPVGADAEKVSIWNEDFNSIVKKSPQIDVIQTWVGKAGDGLKTAGSAAKEIFSSLTGITKLGLKKSTSNPTATTVIAGGGSIFAGLLSIRSLFKTFKMFGDPKTGSWLVSAIQTIIQGGVAVGLGAPFVGKGEKSPFIKRVDGEDVVEVKALLGGIGASLLLGAYAGLEKLPFLRSIKPLVDIKKDGDALIQNLTTAGAIPQNQQQGLQADYAQAG